MSKNMYGLIIMDGFGYPSDLTRSAVLEENTKNLRALADKYPSVLINASELNVGLPEGQPGTSDVGHLTIGTGRIIYQPLVKINKEIESGAFFRNTELMNAIENAKLPGNALHLMGIPSDGGVHGHINHLLALLKMAKDNDVKDVYIHFFSDGRDTPPQSALTYIKIVEDYCNEIGLGKIVNVIGRLYALDRDKNWDRVELAYNAMVKGEGHFAKSATEAIEMAYARGENDEFVVPTVIVDDNNQPLAVVNKNDSIISYDYRADRERQLAYVFDYENTLDFTDKTLRPYFVCMTEYDSTIKNVYVAYPTIKQENILSELLSTKGYKQLKVAETEKFAYITFAFNDGRIDPYDNEDRILINSVKMKSYDGKPEMGAYEIADKTVEGIETGDYDVVVINFANCDMVGHSGNLEATKQAVQVVDECVEKVVNCLLKHNAKIIVTADHGNADIMKYEDGSPNTSHTTNPVPFILISDELKDVKLRTDGNLSDVAPTLLDLMGIEKPEEMSGNTLIVH